MKRNSSTSKEIALGGILASMAVVVMCFGGMFPGMTYVTAIMCALLLKIVHGFCGKRIAWAWYGAVSILSLLMAPDKESAFMFVFLGDYPIVKPFLDRRKLSWLWKSLYFNASFLVMYFLLTNVFGVAQVTVEFRTMGIGIFAFTMILANLIFWTVDAIVGGRIRRKGKNHG